jgi:peroxiredoxin 2/4
MCQSFNCNFYKGGQKMERLVGKQAPYFMMNAVKGDGSGFQEVKLDDYKGKWLVLFFYPLDFTSV